MAGQKNFLDDVVMTRGLVVQLTDQIQHDDQVRYLKF